MLNILLVEDNRSIRTVVSTYLRNNHYNVIECSSGQDALAQLESESPPIDLIITDLKMRPLDGLQLLSRAQQFKPEVEVIVITGVGSIEDGVTAIKEGAYDFLEKPVNYERLLHLIKQVEEKKDLEKHYNSLLEELRGRKRFDTIIGKSEPIIKVLNLISQVSRTDTTVLISGESGTGKELVAHALHNQSKRAKKPMVIVNCGALPEALQESELFGHVKGSFTGAIRDKKGLLEEAHSGTVFFDEVGDMSPSAQIKLLRFLQDGEIRHVGDNHPIKVDVRLIAATNKSLEDKVASNRFREDLFYRLSVIPIHLPPLRERREDIPLLANYFLKKYSAKLGMGVKKIPYKTMRVLQDYDWPGNVRELENAIERAVVLTHNTEILLSALPDRIARKHSKPSSSEIYIGLTLAEAEKRHISRTMQDCDYNLKKAAFRLGIDESQLWSKLREHKLISNSSEQVFRTALNHYIANGQQRIKTLPVKSHLSTKLVDLGITLSQLEKYYILKMLEKTDGNRKQTASKLGISQVTLWRKLKELGIEDNNHHSKEIIQTANHGHQNSSQKVSFIINDELSEYFETAIKEGFALCDLEKQHLMDTLEASNGKKKETALRLGISKATLWRKLKGMNIEIADG